MCEREREREGVRERAERYKSGWVATRERQKTMTKRGNDHGRERNQRR